MNRASPQLRTIAKQLMAFEAPATGSAAADHPAAFRATGKLRPHLSMLMGRSGFQALLARALGLAGAKVAWLTAVRAVADGELEGLAAAHAKLDADEFAEGEVVLLTELLGLLVAFIGPALALRLIAQIWPQLPGDDAVFGQPAIDGKAK